MTSDYAQFEFGKLKVEVNWNEEVKPCEKIRITVDGKEQIIDRADFYSMMFVFGDEAQQEQLIPVERLKVREITRLLTIRAKKDMKRGEKMLFPYTYYIPDVLYQSIRLSNKGSKLGLQSSENMVKLERDVNKSK